MRSGEQPLVNSDGRRLAAEKLGPQLLWAALIAGLVACGIPLLQGIVGGWSGATIAVYSVVAVVFLILSQSNAISALEHFCVDHPIIYLVVQGVLCAIMQSISGDGFIQPIAFTIPLVSAAFWYDARGTSIVGVGYLALMALGLWISGGAGGAGIAFAVASYGALMVFMYSSTRMLVREASARHRADQLAAALAQERGRLQHLATINATLARDLDLARVLDHVAQAGRSFMNDGQVRVWLRDDGEERHLRLATARGADDGDDAASPPPFAAAPVATPHAVIFPFFAKTREIGVLELRQPAGSTFGSTDLDYLRPFADAAGLAITNALLYEQAQASAMLAERNRLARELHDTIAQGLTAVTMQLEAAGRSFERDPVRTRARMGRAHELARSTLDDVRRSVWTLAAPLVDATSLDATLRTLAEEVETRTGVAAAYAQHGTLPPLDHAAATQMVRIAQEALHNVEKHAHAAHVAVELRGCDDEIVLTIRDDGVGFVPDAHAPRADARANGFGLHSLRERARIAGGELRITSAPGRGTTLHVVVPARDADEPTRTP